MGDLAWESAAVVAAALQQALEALAGAVSGAAGGWLALGIVLHVANQVVRGRGWYALLRSACGDDPGLRRRDALLAWVAGAGAGGVLSARGGDAVRILLLSRRLPETRSSLLAGTIVAEAAGDTFVGVAMIVVAVAAGVAPAFGLPGAETAAWVAAAFAVLGVVLAVLRRRSAAAEARGGGRFGERGARVRAIACGVGAGCAMLGRPGTYACTVLPWQAGSRALRGLAVACFLAAFHLPAGVAAVVLVMLAQTGGRLMPVAPASAAAAVAVMTAGFAPATGAAVEAGAVAAFMVGMSTVLTVTGVVLTVAIVSLASGPGALAAVWRAVRPRWAARASAA